MIGPFTIWQCLPYGFGRTLTRVAIIFPRLYGFTEKKNSAQWLHLVKNLNPKVFQKCLKKTAMRDRKLFKFRSRLYFSGTPVVLIGDRQDGREHGENLTAVDPVADQIKSAVKIQLENGRHEPGAPLWRRQCQCPHYRETKGLRALFSKNALLQVSIKGILIIEPEGYSPVALKTYSSIGPGLAVGQSINSIVMKLGVLWSGWLIMWMTTFSNLFRTCSH